MKKMEFEVYKDKKGEWRWRAVCTANKKILADSGEGYKTKYNCMRALKRFTWLVMFG